MIYLNLIIHILNQINYYDYNNKIIIVGIPN